VDLGNADLLSVPGNGHQVSVNAEYPDLNIVPKNPAVGTILGDTVQTGKGIRRH
ncbi:MAG: hypothetical protein HW386_1737, partial [Gammaproteobacteria bacterium]|nr:hypothetical protein [Gammaproteobacteria bacterium]